MPQIKTKLIVACIIGLVLLISEKSQAQNTAEPHVTLVPFVLEDSLAPLVALEPFVITSKAYHPCGCQPNYPEVIKRESVKWFKRNEDLGKKAELNPSGKLYPNPAVEYTTLELSDDTTYDINIYSMQGQLIFSEKVIGTKLRINISDYQPGMYLVNASPIGKEEIITLKLVVK
jgi:hypothetical protein